MAGIDAWQPQANRGILALAMVLLLVGGAICVVVHEAGHAVGAMLAGWRVELISIHGLTIWTRGWRVRVGSRAFADAAGAVCAAPPPRRPYRRGAELALVLGGPAANLVVAAAAITLAAAAPHAFVQRLLEMLALLSAGMGLLNLVPFTTPRGFSSDGRRALEVLRRDPEWSAHETRLAAESLNLKRPQQWDPALVRAVEEEIAAGRGTGAGDMLLFALDLALGDIASARARLARAGEKLGRTDGLVVAEAALADRDSAGAARLLEPVAGRSAANWAFWGTQGAILRLNGKPVDARSSFDEARRLLKRHAFATDEDYRLLGLLEALPPTPWGRAPERETAPAAPPATS